MTDEIVFIFLKILKINLSTSPKHLFTAKNIYIYII